MEGTVQRLMQDVNNHIAEIEKQRRVFEAEMQTKKREFEEWQAMEIEKNQQKAEEIVKKREFEVSEREKKLLAQEQFIRDQQLKNSKTIKLKVGGKKFTTTLTTLTSDKDSMIAAMFSGRYLLEKDESGYYFIDRDGDLFSSILYYLRSGKIPPKLSEDQLIELKNEAQYYQLADLQKALDQPPANCSLLNYGGIYTNGHKAISFLDDMTAFDFLRQCKYTLDGLNKFEFEDSFCGLVLNKHQIALGGWMHRDILDYYPLSLPTYGVVYIHSSIRVVFQEDSIKISNSEGLEEDIKTYNGLTKHGVPIIATTCPSKVLKAYLENGIAKFPLYVTIYCYENRCIVQYLEDRVDSVECTNYFLFEKKTIINTAPDN